MRRFVPAEGTGGSDQEMKRGSGSAEADEAKGDPRRATLLIELGRALRKRCRRFRRTHKRARETGDEDTVHDVRVASRRLLSVLRLVEGVKRKKIYRRIRSDLKATRRCYDRLRNAQVELETLTSTLPQDGALVQAYRNHLEDAIERLREEMRASAPKVDFKRLLKAVRRFRRFVGKASRGRRRGTPEPSEEAMRLIEDLYRSLDRRRAKSLQEGTTFTLHRARIQFKKLRYAIEVLRPILPGADDEYMTGLRRLQTAMGEVQDLAVLRKHMEAFVAEGRLSDGIPAALEQIDRRTHMKLEVAAEMLRAFRLPWSEDIQKPHQVEQATT